MFECFLPREPRGFGFVKFRNPEDAAEAKQQMNHKVIGGREIRIVFAEENRKTPQEMRKNTRVGYDLFTFCQQCLFVSVSCSVERVFSFFLLSFLVPLNAC